MGKYKTPQEEFWAGAFGDEYIGRNDSAELLAANLNLFSIALKQAGRISSCIELGANIGMNLYALRLLYPGIEVRGVEINPVAARALGESIGERNVFEGSIFEYPADTGADLALTKGLLIHIDPEMLGAVYDKLHQSSSRFILLCEYYSPFPVAIPYRGHADRLYKRDFAGEMLDRYSGLRLVDYGFAYRRDPAFPQDDINWFLLEKGA